MVSLIHGIRWRLSNSDDSETIQKGFFHPLGRPLKSGLTDACINVTMSGEEDAEAEFRRLFPYRTSSFWLDYWLNSPLRSEQCAFIEPILAKAEPPRNAERNHRRWGLFLDAIRATAKSDFLLHVALTPLGHAGSGWIHTYDHCPRCKESTPVWARDATENEINCPVCGLLYIPKGTGSRRKWNNLLYPEAATEEKPPDWRTNSATFWESPEIREELARWLEALRELHYQVSEWSSGEGWTITRIPKEFIERSVGPYSSVMLIVRFAKNVYVNLEICERGNLEHGGQLELRAQTTGYRVYLERNEANGGWLVKTHEGLRLRYPWNRETFVQLIRDLLDVGKESPAITGDTIQSGGAKPA